MHDSSMLEGQLQLNIYLRKVGVQYLFEVHLFEKGRYIFGKILLNH